MPSVSLSPELSGYLLQLKTTWEHDNLAETAACLFDIFLGAVKKEIPQVNPITTTKRLRFELRTRHYTFFEKVSNDFGCSVGDFARSILVFLFSPDVPLPLCGTPTLETSATTATEAVLAPLATESLEEQRVDAASRPATPTTKFDMSASFDALLGGSS